jgi:hypothetical protein
MSRSLAALLLAASACSDPCSMVVGCGDSPRVAVEGRVLDEDSRGVSGAAITLLVDWTSHTDSTATVTDDDGLFSVRLAASGSGSPHVSVRVMPPARPGYTIGLPDCAVVTSWGDACVLNPLRREPGFPFFRFRYRNDPSRYIENVRITFRRTGGAPVFHENPPAAFTDSFSLVSVEQGIAPLFPLDVWAGSMSPVVGDLTIDFPDPIGPAVRHAFEVQPRAYFNQRDLAEQLAGPTLAYRFEFADSATDAPIKDVELRYQRSSGVATQSDTFNIRSGVDGKAYFALSPSSFGALVGDLSIKPAQKPVLTQIKGMTLQTFDQDSTLLYARWRVGTTGILYLQSVNGR